MIQGAMCGGLNSFLSYACSLCVFVERWVTSNNANSTLELISMGLELKVLNLIIGSHELDFT